MNEQDQHVEVNERPPLWRRVLSRMNVGHWVLVAVFAWFQYGLIMVYWTSAPYLFQIPYRLAVGWWSFLQRSFGQLRIDWGMITASLAALTLGMAALHGISRWVITRMGHPEGWNLKSTIALTTILLVLSASAIASTVIGHQMAFLGRGGMTYDRSFPPSIRPCFNAQRLAIMASNGNGRMADSLGEVSMEGMSVEEYNRRAVFRLHRDAEPEAWTYLGKGMTTSMPEHLPLIVSPRPVPPLGKYIVAPLEGVAWFADPEEYQKLMDEWRKVMRERKK